MEPLDRLEVESLIHPEVELAWYVHMKEELGERCDHIVRAVAEAQGVEVEWWDFDNAPADVNEGHGEFNERSYASHFAFIGEFRRNGQRIVFSMDGRPNSFPTEWIWLEDAKWLEQATSSVGYSITSDEAQKERESQGRSLHERRVKFVRSSIIRKLTNEELQHVIFKQ